MSFLLSLLPALLGSGKRRRSKASKKALVSKLMNPTGEIQKHLMVSRPATHVSTTTRSLARYR